VHFANTKGFHSVENNGEMFTTQRDVLYIAKNSILHFWLKKRAAAIPLRFIWNWFSFVQRY